MNRSLPPALSADITVDQTDLPESYSETLAVAFEEHRPVAAVIDEILAEAVANVTEN